MRKYFILISSRSLFIAILAYIILVLSITWLHEDIFVATDGYQYLSIAKNYTHGVFAKTSVIYFDTERSHGSIPAPTTTFPPGYPFIIAVLSALGVSSLPVAGIVVSALSGLGLIVAAICLAKQCGLPKSSQAILLTLILGNSTLLVYATDVMSEVLFSFLSLAAIILISRGYERLLNKDKCLGYLIFGNILIGVCYWIRYMGIFLWISVSIFQLILWVYLKNKQSLYDFLTSSISFIIILISMLRNYSLVGTWKGGNEKLVEWNLFGTLHEVTYSLYHLISGIERPYISLVELLFISSLVFILLLFLKRLPLVFNKSGRCQITLVLLMIYISIYLMGMVYAGLTTVVSIGSSRMFLPLLVMMAIVLFAIIKLLISVHHSTRFNVLLKYIGCFSLIGYLILNIQSLSAELQGRQIPYHKEIQLTLSKSFSGNMSILDWIQHNTKKSHVFISNKGQPLSLVINRPILSLSSSKYSKYSWDAHYSKAIFSQFNASYLLIFKEGTNKLFTDNPFIYDLAEGIYPAWMQLIAHDAHAILYMVTD